MASWMTMFNYNRWFSTSLECASECMTYSADGFKAIEYWY